MKPLILFALLFILTQAGFSYTNDQQHKKEMDFMFPNNTMSWDGSVTHKAIQNTIPTYTQPIKFHWPSFFYGIGAMFSISLVLIGCWWIYFAWEEYYREHLGHVH